MMDEPVIENRRKHPDLSVVSMKLDKLIENQERANVALFALNSDNEFGTPGVMTIMQKLNTHIDVWCSIASGSKKFVKFGFWFVTSFGSAVIVGRAAGWW